MLDNGIAFDAAFAGSDMAAITLISSLLSSGLKVPDDVMVASYDNIAAAAYTHPPLATVHQPITEAGKCLVAAVMQRIEGQPSESAMPPTTLVPRASTIRACRFSATAKLASCRTRDHVSGGDELWFCRIGEQTPEISPSTPMSLKLEGLFLLAHKNGRRTSPCGLCP